MKGRIARWESRNGKYNLDMFHENDGTYSLAGREYGSSGLRNLQEAIIHAAIEIETWPVKHIYQIIGKGNVTLPRLLILSRKIIK